VTLFGRCGDGTDCNLVAQRLPDGSVRLAYHGTAMHSMVLDFDQQLALVDMLPTRGRGNGEDQDRQQSP